MHHDETERKVSESRLPKMGNNEWYEKYFPSRASTMLVKVGRWSKILFLSCTIGAGLGYAAHFASDLLTMIILLLTLLSIGISSVFLIIYTVCYLIYYSKGK